LKLFIILIFCIKTNELIRGIAERYHKVKFDHSQPHPMGDQPVASTTCPGRVTPKQSFEEFSLIKNKNVVGMRRVLPVPLRKSSVGARHASPVSLR